MHPSAASDMWSHVVRIDDDDALPQSNEKCVLYGGDPMYKWAFGTSRNMRPLTFHEDGEFLLWSRTVTRHSV
jgi:hypothetical protein